MKRMCTKMLCFFPRRRFKHAATRIPLYCGIMAAVLLLYSKLPNFFETNTPKEIDVNFTLIMPHVQPKLSSTASQLYVAVVVNSAAAGEKHRSLRMAIRKTWGNVQDVESEKHHKWRLFFSLGIAANNTENMMNLHEAFQHNDVLIGNFTDTYTNIIIKTFMGHMWASSKLRCKYVLKTDDDVYVRVPKLMRWLVKSGSPHPFYGGFISPHHAVPRDPSSKWYISEQQFNGTNWPPFCHGGYHVLSTDIIPRYLNFTRYRKPFHADDAYIGVASEHLGIIPTQIPGFGMQFGRIRTRTDCELIMSTAMGHLLDVHTMMKYHSFYETLK